ncbi:MAG TPA: protein adenylyltransferase SelO family protein, partial [Micropepsaceae bacterium]
AALKDAREAIGAFTVRFESAYTEEMRRKLGLLQSRAGDLALAQDLLERMARNSADFTLTFRRLCDAAADPARGAPVRALFADPVAFDEWAVTWRQRLAEDGGLDRECSAAMRAANPLFIPRNHRVEQAISAAVNDNDFVPFEMLLTVLSSPYADQPGHEIYAEPPRPDEIVQQTFCGT